MILEYVTVVLVVLVLILLKISPKKPAKNFPPGPFSWPFVGNLLQLGTEPHIAMAQMKDKYGDIVGLQFGSLSGIAINDLHMIKEAFSMPEFAARPKAYHIADDTKTNRGIIFSSGVTWEEQRRFFIKNLSDFGFGKKNSLETLMLAEVNNVIEQFDKTVGKSVNTRHTFCVAVVNAVWTIVGGQSLPYDDPKIQKLIGHLLSYTKNPKALGSLVFFPGFASLFPNLSGFNEFVNDISKIYDFVKEGIAGHREDYQEGENRDLIDCYLEKIQKTTDPNSTFYKDVGEKNMIFGLHDAFLGSSETLSTSLTWLLFYLAHFPEVQDKLHKSIVEVLGDETNICLDDRKRLPFVEAVVLETLRSSGIFAVGLFREITKTIEFHGYTLPKGTLAFANQHWVLHDPKIWGDPNNFRPERFILPNGTVDSRNEAFIPFGSGKRTCPGEAYARDEMFLFTASLYQRYKIEFDPNAPIPPLDSKSDTPLLSPPIYNVVFQRRSEM